MNSKLSPELRRRTGAPVDLAVEFTGPLDDLKAVGFRVRSVVSHPTQGYHIATGSLPPERLEALGAIEHVVQVEGPRRMRPQLDYSVPEVHADAVHTGTPPYLGRGVIIGIIDTGFDWRHRDFATAPDQSRILALWDMRLTAEATETAGPGDVGVVYEQDVLSQALQHDQGQVRSVDPRGHGTHVAGIAAGNGVPATCCHPSKTYVGVAPAADLILVRYEVAEDPELGANVRLIEAMDFIFTRAASTGQAAVVNISQGDNLGAHDGTSTVELAIDAFLANQTGRAVVVSAGNEAGTRRHVHSSVSSNETVEVEFSVLDGHDSDAVLDVWYARAGTLNLQVVTPGASSDPVDHGDDDSFVANPTDAEDRQVVVDITGTINGAHGRDNNFRITLTQPDTGSLPGGEGWKLRLINPNAGAVLFHCWIDRGVHAPKFLPVKNPPDDKIRASFLSTLTVPATSASAISVANHASRTGWCDCFPSTGIVDSSSRGPVARDATANPKPDLAAPGLKIRSAKADAANQTGHCCSCCPDACCCLYQDMDGTSMSAPHVAGAIALMLEKNPTLTRAKILEYLQLSARPPPAGESRTTWGAGKLDVRAAMDRVPAGGGGGSGVRAVPRMEDAPASREPPPALRILRARLMALPEGEALAAAVSRHFSEVRRLINTNRRVATLWHRGSGPRMLRCLLDGALDPEAPAALGTEAQRAYLERWCGLLARHGSPKLRASLTCHRERVFALLGSPLAAQVLPDFKHSHPLTMND
ncbi:S8 family serine peptidase [Corallococcus sp. bb12-1]|uniref:S8 family serine peptidase n=1 Tax=Corallococcus sp. bb12-1 TaxID=2996784 RepID=UPI002270A95D|nr:S8 family serine peptidase [Corallococcus sp. bb12-1]MCY1039707.1 S8 family serine peptidase [Corallococcus sp. bb12-1]